MNSEKHFGFIPPESILSLRRPAVEIIYQPTGQQMRYFILLVLTFFLACSALKKADQSYEQGDYRLTINECKEVLAQDSTRVDAYLLMARAYMAIDKADSAEMAAARAWDLEPGDQETRTLYITILLNLAQQKEKNKNFYEAISLYKKVLTVEPKQPEVLKKLADLYYRNGRIDEALSLYQQSLSVVQDSLLIAEKIVEIKERIIKSKSYLEKGKQALEKNRIKNAVRFLSTALDLKPDSKPIKYYHHMAKGRQLYKQGGKSELWDAIEHFGLAATLRPDLGEPHYRMGLAYHKKDRDEYDNAISEFKKAYKINPDGPYAEESLERSRELVKKKKIMREFWGK
jgi:tetratricopeptide (TPR) repeat protein